MPWATSLSGRLNGPQLCRKRFLPILTFRTLKNANVTLRTLQQKHRALGRLRTQSIKVINFSICIYQHVVRQHQSFVHIFWLLQRVLKKFLLRKVRLFEQFVIFHHCGLTVISSFALGKLWLLESWPFQRFNWLTRSHGLNRFYGLQRFHGLQRLLRTHGITAVNWTGRLNVVIIN